MKPLLAITMGDVNGVGPEILAKAFARPESWRACRPMVIGSIEAYDRARSIVHAGPAPYEIDSVDDVRETESSLPFLAGSGPFPPFRPGVLDADAGRAALRCLGMAVRLAIDDRVDGIVTCPINKQGIHLAGFAFQGHTDFIAELTGAPDYRMSLFTDTMRIVHISAHVSLREALTMVKRDRIADTIRIAHNALLRLDLPRRRIAVAGLNPHAGEAGAFGSEEQEEIAPAVKRCRAEGIDCSGPHSPDTLFGRMRAGEFDLVVAMYHDQGHIPLKLIAMDEGVNVTLGIPIVRTSVDHGTAYDIAGTGVAREHSLCAAISLAAKLAVQRQEAAR